MSKGGVFFLHDYLSNHWSGVKKAVDEFCAEHGEFIIVMSDKSGSAFLRKTK
jgi:O-methyltransferase